MIKKTNLIICPVCLEQGKTYILGELQLDGDFIIKRDRNTIRIRAQHLQVVCNECNEVVYIRQQSPLPRTVIYEELFGKAVQ